MKLLRAIGAFFYGFFGYSTAFERGGEWGWDGGYEDGMNDGKKEGYAEGYIAGEHAVNSAGFERAVETVREWYPNH